MTFLHRINVCMTHLSFYLAITRHSIDTLPVSAQWWQVKIHSICKTITVKFEYNLQIFTPKESFLNPSVFTP